MSPDMVDRPGVASGGGVGFLATHPGYHDPANFSPTFLNHTHVRRAGAKILAAAAAGAILCIEDVQPDRPAQGQGPDLAVEAAFAAAVPAAAGARVGQRLTADRA